MGFEQISLVFERLMYNQITSKYMLRAKGYDRETDSNNGKL